MPRPSASPPFGLTRRQFGQRAVTAALAAAPLACQSHLSPDGEKGTDSDSEARYQEIIRRYGGRLSGQERARLRKILAYNKKLLAPIRSFPLDNGQPAATVLKFYEDPGVQAAPARPRAASGRRTKE